MSTVCGCGQDSASVAGAGARPSGGEHEQEHRYTHPHEPQRDSGCGHSHDHGEHGHDHRHDPSHDPENDHGHCPDPVHTHARGTRERGLHYGAGLAGVHVAGLSQERIVQIELDILGKNDGFAARNREVLAAHGTFALNLVSSPGSGKTMLLVRSIEALRARLAIAVIEGDQQTSNDAERIRAAGAPALQINTGKGCHLDAHMVGHALDRIRLANGGVLFIENVGNLVCPAAFDLGEAHKVAILSVTEGEDKPLKYPDMFQAASVMVLSKIDLLPHVEFDVAACVAAARRVNPAIEVIQLSARTGQGMPEWLAWVEAGARAAAVSRGDELATLRARVAGREAGLANGGEGL